MIKKSITYVDFNGTERTEDFYFNLTQAELIKLEVSAEGGFFEAAKGIIDSKETTKILAIFERLLSAAYGVKSDDGRDFVKSDDLWKRFETSEAYSVLFIGLLTDANEGAKLFNGLVPAGMAETAAKMEANNAEMAKKLQAVTDPPSRIHLTHQEMTELPREEIERRLKRGDMPPAPTP